MNLKINFYTFYAKIYFLRFLSGFCRVRICYKALKTTLSKMSQFSLAHFIPSSTPFFVRKP